jgi:putative glutamine amidotransferase
VTPRPAIAVTATSEIIRHVPRTRANVAYTDALLQAGARPYILPVVNPEHAHDLLDGMQALLLTGGEDVDPRHYAQPPHAALGETHEPRDACELALVHAARERRLPTLAICRGNQLANVALGGTLVQDVPTQCAGSLAHDGPWPRTTRVHEVMVTDASRLAGLVGATRLRVNSFHHQALGELASGFAAVAHAPDGVIEGAEWVHDDWWLVGVQWHPEELTGTTESWDRALFAGFIQAALDAAPLGAISSTAASAPHS